MNPQRDSLDLPLIASVWPNSCAHARMNLNGDDWRRGGLDMRNYTTEKH
jgi:hypothetical protein